jgi:hypothetical protein
LCIIAVVTLSLASFNVAVGVAGTKFGWNQPYIAINAAHARAIVAIIGDRGRDPRPATVTVDQAVSDIIEATTGIKAPTALDWGSNLSFWSGREITATNEPLWLFPTSHQNLPLNGPHYSVSVVRTNNDSDTTYQVGSDRFQVVAVPNP